MKRNNGQPSTRGKTGRKSLPKGPFEMVQFFINNDPKRLEDSSGRVFSCVATDCGRDRSQHQLGQLLSGTNRLCASFGDDGPCNPISKGFFTKLFEGGLQLLCGAMRKEFGSRFTKGRIEPQIERSSGLKPKAAVLVGQLIGREPEVDEDPIRVRGIQLGKNGGNFGIATGEKMQRQGFLR